MNITFTIVILFVLAVLLLTAALISLTRLYMRCTNKMCTSSASMAGKVVIVTGANTGIGYHTAEDLAARGARVILACRNEQRALAAQAKLISVTGNSNIVYKHLNLSSLESVRKFAEEVLTAEERLDVLVNNAGVHGMPNHTTDGIVECMQINYFAPFLLTLLLLPLLKNSQGRIVNLCSLLHFIGTVNFDYINKANYYSDTKMYGNSKLCMLLFTRELAKRLKGMGVTVNAVHPGVMLTNIVPEDAKIHIKLFFKVWCWLCCRTAAEGAQTVIYLSVAEECANDSGKYFTDFKPRIISYKARNEQLAEKLWQFSEKLVKHDSQCIEISITCPEKVEKLHHTRLQLGNLHLSKNFDKKSSAKISVISV